MSKCKYVNICVALKMYFEITDGRLGDPTAINTAKIQKVLAKHGICFNTWHMARMLSCLSKMGVAIKMHRKFLIYKSDVQRALDICRSYISNIRDPYTDIRVSESS